MRIPTTVIDGDEPDAGLHQSSGKQAALAEVVSAVRIAEFVRLLLQVERLLCNRRGDQVECLCIEVIQGLDYLLTGFGFFLESIQRLQYCLASVDAVHIHAVRRAYVPNGEIWIVWVAVDVERVI